MGSFEITCALLIEHTDCGYGCQARPRDDLHVSERVDLFYAVMLTSNQGLNIAVVNFLFAIAQLFETFKEFLEFVV